jgi:hypothetical protein
MIQFCGLQLARYALQTVFTMYYNTVAVTLFSFFSFLLKTNKQTNNQTATDKESFISSDIELFLR